MSDEEKEKVEHIVVGFRGRFSVCNQGVNISILRDRKMKRQKKERKELICSNNFVRVLALSLQGFGEKEQSPVHTPSRRHTLWEREIVRFYCADEIAQCYPSCTLHQRLTDAEALTKKTKTHGWYSGIH